MDPELRGRQTAEVLLLWQFLFNYSLIAGCKNFSVLIVIKITIGPIASNLSELIRRSPEHSTHGRLLDFATDIQTTRRIYETQISCNN